MSPRNHILPFPDRVMGWIGAVPRREPQPLPGPRGIAAYARVGWARSSPGALEPRLRLLVTQLAAVSRAIERAGFALVAAGFSTTKLTIRDSFPSGVMHG